MVWEITGQHREDLRIPLLTRDRRVDLPDLPVDPAGPVRLSPRLVGIGHLCPLPALPDVLYVLRTVTTVPSEGVRWPSPDQPPR